MRATSIAASLALVLATCAPAHAERLQTLLCVATASGNCQSVPSSFTTARRLDILFTSGHCDLGASDSVTGVVLVTTLGDNTVAHHIVPFMPTQTASFSFAQQTQIFADADTSVHLGVLGVQGSAFACAVSISAQ